MWEDVVVVVVVDDDDDDDDVVVDDDGGLNKNIEKHVVNQTLLKCKRNRNDEKQDHESKSEKWISAQFIFFEQELVIFSSCF